jgi:hypothetical protein
MPVSTQSVDEEPLDPAVGDEHDQSPLIPQLDPITLDNFSLDVNHFLRKDYEDIALASIELPPIVEWINCKLMSLTEQKLKKEDEVKELEAKAWFYLNDGGWEDRDYKGRKNAYALLAASRLDSGVKQSKAELATLVAWCQRLYNVMTSFQAKLDLVRTAEATRRRIFDSEGHNG